jgi:stearoyl-CoA desaturase (delta-9 desaturase)
VKLFEIPAPNPNPPQLARSLREFQWLKSSPMVLMHLVPFAAFWTGTKWQDWAVCFGLYFVRMFGVTGAYHRYFAHRTYKTSRVFQFVLAFLAQTSSQKGALWWGAHHRHHHKYSDHDKDPHDSRRGFWYSHIGWLFDHTDETDYKRIHDLAKYPELVALNKLWAVPPALLGFGVWWFMGWSGLFIGFALSTVLLWHGTFTINSLSHMLGKPRYDSNDASKNNWFLAIITLGEGWHNNHHYCMTTVRQGFFWWEYDITFYILKALSWVGLVWDLKPPPARVYDESNMLPHARRRARAAAASSPSVLPDPVASAPALPPAA